MSETPDLFGDAPQPSVPASAPCAPDPERVAYLMTPAGLNRWTYKGEIVMYDSHKLAVPGRGRWSSLEGIGKPEIRGDSHVEICKAFDARRNPVGSVDCGECPRTSTGCAAGKCLRAAS